jgi:hypothetical protein
MVLVVEVGGVTRGTPVDRPGGARSPWIRPVIVELDCGASLQRRVRVDVGQVPGFQAESAALVLPDADRRCEVRPLDNGVDPEADERAAVTWVDGRLAGRGVAVPVKADEGRERLVRVNVMFASSEVAAAAPARQPAAEGGDQPLSPALTAGLAGLFALGLAGAVARARRPS